MQTARAQDTVVVPLPSGVDAGPVTSEVPAATTGTAPLDSNTPSGTGTTGTSGTTMEQAAENDNYSVLWLMLLAVALAGIVMAALRRKRKS